MLSRQVTALWLAAVVIAAGGGAYFATRALVPPGLPDAVTSDEPGTALPGATPSKSPVMETEETISDEPAELEPTPTLPPPSARPKRRARSPEPARTAEVPPTPVEPVATTASRAPAPPTEPISVDPPHDADAADETSDEGWSGLEEPWPAPGRDDAGEVADATSDPYEGPIAPLPGPIDTEDHLPLPTEPLVLLEEFVVSADSVIGLQVETTVTTETARIEDPVDARVTRDVKVGSDIAIPAGSEVVGSITLVEAGGKMKERARLGVRFHTVVLADGTRLPIRTATVYREGDSPAGKSAAKIGGAAVGGAIIGAILGGSTGAVLGGSAGAAGGTAAVMAGGRKPAVLQAGSTMTVRLSEPVTVTVEKE